MKKKPRLKKKLCFIFLALSIASLVGTIITAIKYFKYNSVKNSIEYIEMAQRSIREAFEFNEKVSMFGWLSIILGSITFVFIVVTVIFFILRIFEKKREAVLYENQQK